MPYDYEYSLKDPDARHTFFSKAYRKTLVLPNRVVVSSREDDDPQRTPGVATSAASYALLPKSAYFQTRLADNLEGQAIAEAMIANLELNSEMGSFTCPMNVGQELYDYVKITDERSGDSRVGNIGSIIRRYSVDARNGAKDYSMQCSFGDPPTVRAIKEQVKEIQTTLNLERLWVQDLHATHIQADALDMIWLDPDTNIDPSLFNMDNVPDGESYARVKSLHLDAGQIKMDENVYYSTGYNPSQKRRTFTTTPTTPYDVGDLWLDASTVKRCTTARATGAYVAGDWTATTYDALADGTTYVGIKSTEINAGRIALTATNYYSGKFSGEWYSESGVEIDASHGINIYGADMALTTRATKTGTVQCYVGSDGAIYAGAGAIKLNADGGLIDCGISTLSWRMKRVVGGSTYYGYEFLDSTGDYSLYATADVHLDVGGNIYAHDHIYCYAAGNYLIGSSSFYFGAVHCTSVVDYSPLELSYKDAVKLVKNIKNKPGSKEIDKDSLPEMVLRRPTPEDFADCEKAYQHDLMLYHSKEPHHAKYNVKPKEREPSVGFSLPDLIGLSLAAIKELAEKVENLEKALATR